MNDLTTDRSGRTLKDYRELYWQSKERIAELETNLNEYKDAECRAVKAEGEALKRIAEQEATIKQYKNGFKGACLCCESVGGKNIELQATIKQIEIVVDKIRYCGSHSLAEIHINELLGMFDPEYGEALGEQDEG
ncbi:hypothetical protein N9937_01185 [bacterium]|nr:hypothetical protein [bacterium]